METTITDCDPNMRNQYTPYIRLMQGANSLVEGNSVDIDFYVQCIGVVY